LFFFLYCCKGVFGALRIASLSHYWLLLLFTIGATIGEGFVVNAVSKMAITWFPENEQVTATALGSVQNIFSLVF
jgi:hypothetical protein